MVVYGFICVFSTNKRNDYVHIPPFMHTSIRASSKPAVCDLPHMQSCCRLHCFVFKEEDCLNKPREIAKPAIICIILSTQSNTHVCPVSVFRWVSQLLIALNLPKALQPTIVNLFTIRNIMKCGDI